MIELIFEFIIDLIGYSIAHFIPWVFIGTTLSFVITFIIIPSFFNGDFNAYLFVGLSVFFSIVFSSIEKRYNKQK